MPESCADYRRAGPILVLSSLQDGLVLTAVEVQVALCGMVACRASLALALALEQPWVVLSFSPGQLPRELLLLFPEGILPLTVTLSPQGAYQVSLSPQSEFAQEFLPAFLLGFLLDLYFSSVTIFILIRK